MRTAVNTAGTAPAYNFIVSNFVPSIYVCLSAACTRVAKLSMVLRNTFCHMLTEKHVKWRLRLSPKILSPANFAYTQLSFILKAIVAEMP